MKLLTLADRRFTWQRHLADLENCIETLNGQGDFEGGLEITARALRIESLVNRLERLTWIELERMLYGERSRSDRREVPGDQADAPGARG